MLIALRVLMRTAHLVAATAWVGGSIFYLVALVPALRATGPSAALAAKVGEYFRKVVSTSMGVLVLTGVYLTFDRLSTTALGPAYLIVLGLKVVVALTMMGLALYQAQEGVARLRQRRPRTGWWSAVPRLILALGLLAFVLGALLTTLYEMTPRA